jgi:hypothetical protein
MSMSEIQYIVESGFPIPVPARGHGNGCPFGYRRKTRKPGSRNNGMIMVYQALHFIEGYSQREIARTFGVHPSAVNQACNYDSWTKKNLKYCRAWRAKHKHS